jgi:hypothetical protein
MKHFMSVALLSLALLTPALAGADDEPGNKKKHKPPPAAFDACKDKAEGDACSFAGRKGTVNGTCKAKKGGALFCKRAPKQK